MFRENFDTGADRSKWDCTHAINAFRTNDGTSEGPWAMKVDAWNADAYLRAVPDPPLPGDGNWIYTSFALYIPSWSVMWDGGTGWDPIVISFENFTGTPASNYYIQPNSPTSGTIETNFGGGVRYDSDPIPDGQWVAVEVARRVTVAAGYAEDAQFWINNVSTGGIQTGGSGNPTDSLWLGDVSWAGSGATADQVRYYLDDFYWDTARIGPVDLSAAYFNGVGSGIDTALCASIPVSIPVFDGHPAFKAHA